jgi:hypothetical protein
MTIPNNLESADDWTKAVDALYNAAMDFGYSSATSTRASLDPNEASADLIASVHKLLKAANESRILHSQLQRAQKFMDHGANCPAQFVSSKGTGCTCGLIALFTEICDLKYAPTDAAK